MKNTFFILMLLFLITGCEPKDNYIDTGICNGKHDCTIYEYLHTDSYDWDSTVLLINRANMVDLFSGVENITFWGPTNHSIRRYLYQNDYEKVADMDPLECRSILEKYIVRGKYMTVDIAFQIPDINGQLLGGTKLKTIAGTELHAYKQQKDWGDIEGAGAVVLLLKSLSARANVPVASPDIECTNGVVHSIGYEHMLDKI